VDDPVGHAEFAEEVAGDLAGGAIGLQRGKSGTGRGEVADDSHAGDSVAGKYGKSTAGGRDVIQGRGIDHGGEPGDRRDHPSSRRGIF
jgi:hypothetical protein